MRRISMLIGAVLLVSGSVSAKADSRTESWLNGLAMELTQVQIASDATVQGFRCCAEEKSQIEKRFQSTFEAISKAKASAAKGRFVCSRMDFVRMNLGMLDARMSVLILSLNAPENGNAFTQADRARFQSITDRVDAMEASAQAKRKQLGC